MKLAADPSQLTYGQSITDARIDLPTTLELLDTLAEAVRQAEVKTMAVVLEPSQGEDWRVLRVAGEQELIHPLALSWPDARAEALQRTVLSEQPLVSGWLSFWVYVTTDQRMTYLMQFCGLSDPLQQFYLEQRISAASTAAEPCCGPAFGGFRPLPAR